MKIIIGSDRQENARPVYQKCESWIWKIWLNLKLQKLFIIIYKNDYLLILMVILIKL